MKSHQKRLKGFYAIICLVNQARVRRTIRVDFLRLTEFAGIDDQISLKKVRRTLAFHICLGETIH